MNLRRRKLREFQLLIPGLARPRLGAGERRGWRGLGSGMGTGMGNETQLQTVRLAAQVVVRARLIFVK